MKTKKIRQSIMFKILAPLLIFLVLQTFVILFIFFASNVFAISENNAYDAFNEKVITRKDYTEKEMVNRFASFDYAIDGINKTILDMTTHSSKFVNYATKEKQDIFLTKTLDVIINTIKNNGVTGAYIILAEKEVSFDKLSGVYLRCETPSVSNPLIFINIAPTYVKKNGLTGVATLAKNNLEYFDFSKGGSDYDYFFKPYNAVLDSGMTTQTNEYYAFWATPHKILKDGVDVISYSIPLFYDGRLYGIFGIDVSLIYMKKYFPQTELDSSNQAAYAFCSSTSDNSYETMVKSGTLYNKVLGESNTINLNECKESKSKLNFLINNGGKSKEKFSACVSDLKLYRNNAYFAENKFFLIGIIANNILLSFTTTLTKIIIISVLVTSLVGSLIVIMVALYISIPVAHLPQKVKEYSYNTQEQIQRTGIYEIDTLITSIEELSSTVTQNASKMSKIIELSGAPLGAFELNKIDESIVFTDKVSVITDNNSLQSGKISADEFKSYLKELEKHRIEADDYNQLYSFITKTGETRFITMQSVETDSYLIGVLQDVTKERINRTLIEYERDYDVLTGLLNRRAFLTATKKMFSGNSYELGCAAVVLMDIDNLKVINDTFGHTQGDEYLKVMAKTLKAFLSECRVFISRYSGDEYVMMLYGYESKARLQEEIEKLALFIGESYMLMATNQKVKLRCSGGIAFYPEDANNFDELVAYADYAMYEIKQTTKGKFNEFKKDNYSKREYRSQYYEKLNSLIEKNLVDYYYQPIVSLKTGKTLGFESLMRSLEPSFSTPQDILNLASAQHKLYYIERLTWFNALAKYSERMPSSSPYLIFINSIPSHVLTSEDIEFVEKTYSNFVSKVVIEFTEAEKLNEDYANIKKETLKRWGGKIALDDFGAGYSNDAVLLTLNPYYIKVDMFIVRDCDKNQSKRRLLQNIVTYANERKIKVIAEGVETRAELETIIRCKVDYVQGFYVARPNKVPCEISQAKQDEIIEINNFIKNKIITKDY